MRFRQRLSSRNDETDVEEVCRKLARIDHSVDLRWGRFELFSSFVLILKVIPEGTVTHDTRSWRKARRYTAIKKIEHHPNPTSASADSDYRHKWINRSTLANRMLHCFIGTLGGTAPTAP